MAILKEDLTVLKSRMNTGINMWGSKEVLSKGLRCTIALSLLHLNGCIISWQKKDLFIYLEREKDLCIHIQKVMHRIIQQKVSRYSKCFKKKSRKTDWAEVVFKGHIYSNCDRSAS